MAECSSVVVGEVMLLVVLVLVLVVRDSLEIKELVVLIEGETAIRSVFMPGMESHVNNTNAHASSARR